MNRISLTAAVMCFCAAGPVILATPTIAQTVNCSGVAAWSGNSVSYAVGALVTYNGSEYKCLQAHTSQPGWDPVDAPALWSNQGTCSTSTTGGTCSSAPSAPTGLSASSTTSSSTNLSWSAVTPPTNCSISSYTVYKNGASIATTSTTSFSVTGLSASTSYTFTVAATDSVGTGAQSSSISVTTSSSGSTEGPYGGTPAAIPGTVQAENYDTGGEGVGYHVTSVNGSGNSYRTDGVDLESTTDTGGGYDLGWTAAGQWFRYTVNVASAGTYNVTFRVANGTGSNGSFHIQNASGTNLSGSVTVAPTGGWQNWTSVSGTVALPAGQQILTISQDTGGYNFNWISFASASTSCTTKPSAPSGLTASGTTSSSTTLNWNSVSPPANCSISGYTVYQGSSAIATVSSGTSYTVTGLASSTTYSFTVAANDGAGTGSQSASVSVTTQAGSSVTTTGSISFHVMLGVNNSSETLTLTGGNYDDLIMSNIISGVMYAHMVKEYYPGIQFNNDYLVGSNFAQLLQENIATYDYTSSSNLIDPSPDQQAVMGTGQGGPYQINNYAVDMVSGGTAPAGHSLINYIAIQKNIGYTMATASNQSTQPTPASFNNKYYGPMLPAFFHYNDMVALNIIGKGPGGWQTPWEPAYDNALANFVNLPNSFLEMILNVAYNQGYYGGLVASYSQKGATATSSTVASVDSYSSVWGDSSTYDQYPYQVHYYLDQLYDNPVPTTSATTTTTPANHEAFNMTTLENVFSNVFQTMDYSNGTNPAQYFTASQATSAYTSALSSVGLSATATLDLSNASDRAKIFSVLDKAMGNLETAVGMKFNATTNNQL